MSLIRQLSHLLASLVSSSRRFRQEWSRSRISQDGGLAGRWRGEWRSSTNGHCGPLRCVLSTAKELQYTAIFHAVYWKVLRVSYSVPLELVRTNDHFSFQGQVDLGKLAGGVYRFAGVCTFRSFDGTYENRYGRGHLQMTRID